MYKCHQCKRTIDLNDTIGRTETCPFCDADLHCCLNCQFHDPGAYNECREIQAERVLEKDRANFCDYFSFKDELDNKPTNQEQSQKRVNPLDNLFKKMN
jgi:hypothetical protein